MADIVNDFRTPVDGLFVVCCHPTRSAVADTEGTLTSPNRGHLCVFGS